MNEWVKESWLNQVKVLTWDWDLRETQVDVPCLLNIPALDRIAGLGNRYPNSTRRLCLR